MRTRIRALWNTLLHEHTSPSQLALAVWLGVIIGCSPLFGFHLLITLAVGFVLRLNKLVMYGAAQVSIPPLVPFLAFASMQLGHRALTGEWHSLNLEEVRGQPIRDVATAFFTEWLLGGFLFGAALGAVAAVITYAALASRGPLARAAKRYAGAPPQYAWYARIKYRMDPVYESIGRHIGAQTHTVDLGAGLGMLGVFLAELGERTTHGIEWDEGKVAAGQLAGEGSQATLEQGDITLLKTLPAADAVTIVDVLHYFDEARIARLLDVAKSALKPGGKLLVREGDLQATGMWTRALEHAAVKLGWNKAPQVRFLSKERLIALLQERGLTVDVEHVSGPAHPGNWLFVGTLSENR